MIRAVYGKTYDQTLLKQAMPILLKEYAFWTAGEAFSLNKKLAAHLV